MFLTLLQYDEYRAYVHSINARILRKYDKNISVSKLACNMLDQYHYK